MAEKISIDVPLKAEFYDVDSMNIVWHGNYVKYYEQARCALLDMIGYNYINMKESGYAWPVVTMESKFIKPLTFNQHFIIRATLVEYENRIKISYLILNRETGEKMHKGSSTQMAVDIATGNSLFVSPPVFLDKIEAFLKDN